MNIFTMRVSAFAEQMREHEKNNHKRKTPLPRSFFLTIHQLKINQRPYLPSHIFCFYIKTFVLRLLDHNQSFCICDIPFKNYNIFSAKFYPDFDFIHIPHLSCCRLSIPFCKARQFPWGSYILAIENSGYFI